MKITEIAKKEFKNNKVKYALLTIILITSCVLFVKYNYEAYHHGLGDFLYNEKLPLKLKPKTDNKQASFFIIDSTGKKFLGPGIRSSGCKYTVNKILGYGYSESVLLFKYLDSSNQEHYLISLYNYSSHCVDIDYTVFSFNKNKCAWFDINDSEEESIIRIVLISFLGIMISLFLFIKYLIYDKLKKQVKYMLYTILLIISCAYYIQYKYELSQHLELPLKLKTNEDPYGTFSIIDTTGETMIGPGIQYIGCDYRVAKILGYCYNSTSISVKCLDSNNQTRYLFSNAYYEIYFRNVDSTAFSYLIKDCEWIDLAVYNDGDTTGSPFFPVTGIIFSLIFIIKLFFYDETIEKQHKE